jgi:hypothetical protein
VNGEFRYPIDFTKNLDLARLLQSLPQPAGLGEPDGGR